MMFIKAFDDLGKCLNRIRKNKNSKLRRKFNTLSQFGKLGMEKLQEKMKNFEVISLSGEILSDYCCYRLNVCAPPPPHFMYWILIPSVMVFGYGAFGRDLGHEGEALMNGISALMKGTPERSLASFAM